MDNPPITESSRKLFLNKKFTINIFLYYGRLIDSIVLQRQSTVLHMKLRSWIALLKNKFLPLVVSVHLDSTLEEGGRVGLKQFSDT